MRKSTSPLASFALGLGLLFLLQLIAGLILLAFYDPTLAGAHQSVQELRDGPYRFLQNFHYWGSSLLIGLSLLCIVAMIWKGAYKEDRHVWYVVVLFFLLAFGFQVTGNLLPMDRHDVQTAVIEGSIAGRMPGVGPQMREALLAGDSFAQPTLDRWRILHEVVLTIALLVTLFIAWPLNRERRHFLTLVPLALALIMSFVPAAAGAAATSADFNSQTALVSWYTWPLHGMLRMFDSISPDLAWIGVFLIPGLFALFLLILPQLRRMKPTTTGFLFAGFAALFLASAFVYGGSFAPPYGFQDPPAEASAADATEIPEINPSLVNRGRRLFTEMGCMGCHSIDGSKRNFAPDLTTVHERYPDPKWYKRFIRNPDAVRPGSTMPAHPDLTEEELAALADFLRRER